MKRHLDALLAFTLLALTLAPQAAHGQKFGIVDRWNVGGDGGWDYLNIDPGSRRLFVSRSTRIDVIDIDSGKKIGEIDGLKGTHEAVCSAKLNRGWTSNGGDSTVTVFDFKTFKVLDTIKVGERPDAIIFDPASNRVFTCNGGSHDSTVIDGKTGKVVGTVPLGGRPEASAIDGKGHLFVNIEDKGEIFEFDTKTLQPVKRWSIAPAEGPSGLSMDVKHHRLFSVTDGAMVVSDADAGKVLATVPIGQGPDASAFDPKLGLAFSSNGAGTLTVVHEDSPSAFSVRQDVATQRSARTCALDPKTHRIFLAAADVKPGDGQSRRRQIVPGSFTILVVGPK